MTTTRQTGSFGKPLRSWIKRYIQVNLLGMDIHASAKIAFSAWIDQTAPRRVHIGPDSLICEEARILVIDRIGGTVQDTRIGARCYIGPRAIIMPGATVGDDCLVMPGTLITGDLPAHSIAAGNPARINARAPEMD